MKQRVSQVICNSDGRLRAGDAVLDICVVKDFLRRIPRRRYRVTYRINPRGRLLYHQPSFHWGVGHVEHIITNLELPVCFLPPEWDGLHVSRTVMPMKRRKE